MSSSHNKWLILLPRRTNLRQVQVSHDDVKVTLEIADTAQLRFCDGEMEKEVVKEVFGAAQIMLAKLQSPSPQLIVVLDKHIDMGRCRLYEFRLFGVREHIYLLNPACPK